MNVNIEIDFLDFLKNDIWTYVVYDLDGRMVKECRNIEEIELFLSLSIRIK